ncbi:MAG: FAD-dependent oxidoreductase [Clostridia bacterium]|nr:FAD-dependent oxidoreductase [Clostridia bacterium]
MENKKQIVVLGAGYGGVLTAKKLAKKFKKNDDVVITLIDKNPYHTMLTELHEVAAGRVPEDAIRIELKKIFAGRPVDVVLDYIEKIDFDQKKLIGKKEYSYDYLVLGTGSKPTYFGCEGAKENSLPLWSFDDAVRIKEHIQEMFRRASIENNPEERKKLLTFVVVGCGFTGIEMIGELAEWRERLCKTYGIDPQEVNLNVVDVQDKVLPIFKDKLIEKTERYLTRKNVNILTSTNITAVQKDCVCINNTEKLFAYTVIWAAGVEGSDITGSFDLEKKARNRVVTNDKLQSVDHENVFVVGDNIFFIPEGEERPVPQMVENAEHSSKLVANNLHNLIVGKEMSSYKPSFHGAMVCIGGRYGVAQVGTAKKQFAMSGFFAMFVKHFINVIYFLQVAGFNKIWTYAMHEIFHVPDRRSFLGGHFSKRSPNFWLVPMRLFLGFSWLLEGWHKLPAVLKNPNDIFLIPSGVDASSSASVVEEAVNQVEALGVPQFISKIVDAGMDLMFYHADGSYTFMATIFQTAMVFAEILVGLALIAGLFTALSSIVSVIMTGMIWSSGMAAPDMLWYLFAGIAMIGGSGSTFGLDYYVLPILKKWWKKRKIVKKWYIYTD